MGSSFIQNLQDNNEFPIIFIGSGITQRYFKNSPNWDQLLEKIWNETNIKQKYLSRYNQLKNESKDDFTIYTQLADELEESFDQAFYDEKVKIANLSPEEAHDKKISPFRTKISSIFSKLEKRDNIEPEIYLFQSMLKKARIIVTTNYDTFIESLLKSVDVRVGNKGLFNTSDSFNVLYKIHGSVDDPSSIVITTNDYARWKRTSAIVNAKILSQLTESPILFLGYSLTDRNVQTLLKDLADNMPFPIEKASKRIGVVDYKMGEKRILETLCDTDFGVHYTRLTTDNFQKIYEAISKVNQGFSPLEISKYQSAFRQIIDVKGKEGELKQVLTSFVDLDQLSNEMKSKNLVVAFGDKRYIYKYPDYVDYIKSYYSNDEMPLEIALKVIAKTTSNTTLPIYKYFKNKYKFEKILNDKEIKKINKRIKKFSSLKDLNIIKTPKKYISILNKIDYDNPQSIFLNNKEISIKTKLDYFSSNIDNYCKKTALNLIRYILNSTSNNFIEKTACRKLFMAYSLTWEGKVKEIKV